MIHALVAVEKSSRSVMVPKEISDLKKRIDDLRVCCHIDELEETHAKNQKAMESPDFWDDTENASKLSKEDADVAVLIDKFRDLVSLYDDTCAALELAEEDESFASTVNSGLEKLEDMIGEMEIESWFSGKFDRGSAIMSINPGQGGLEAQDWTEMLYRMYCHYADKKGWSTKTLDIARGERIGIDRATLQIDGRNVYGMLKSEIGVHRLVRISPTDIKKRRHTTFASVEVLPVLPDDIEVNIDPSDLRVDVYRSSGPGGQCVNTTDSAVRITHEPTGIVVTCQNEKSQLLNKEAAMSVLRSKLYELEEQKRADELDELRGKKEDSSFGSQIRNYVLYPFQLVKDTRSQIETSNTGAVLDGDLDEFVIGYHKYIAAK